MTNYNERLDEILGRIISQESSREGGWAEFFAGTKEYLEAAPYGNPLEKQQELKQAITSLIKELVAEARIDELKHLIDDDGIWYQDMTRQFPQKIRLDERIKELEV